MVSMRTSQPATFKNKSLDLVKIQSDFLLGLGWGPGVCLFHKHPGKVHAIGPWITLGIGSVSNKLAYLTTLWTL